jgi:hypothetical protein
MVAAMTAKLRASRNGERNNGRREIAMNCISTVQRLLAILAIGLLTACSGIDTHIDAQPDFNPASYRNYAWGTPPLVDSQNAQLLQIDRVVRAAVDSGLQQRGFARVDNSSADALLDYRLATHMDVSQPGGNSPRDDAARAMDLNRSSATDVAVYNHPTQPYIERVELLLSLQAKQSGVIVWQGNAIKNVDNANPGERFSDADIQRAVSLLLDQLKAPRQK